MDIRELRYDLDAWARWKVSGETMPNACNLNKLMEASGGVARSRPPAGVEIPSRLAALIEGMETLPLFQDIGECILAVRLIYQRGQNATLEQCARVLGVTIQKLKSLRRSGETALLGWMIAKGY